MAEASNVLEQTTFAGELDDEAFDSAISAVDVSIHLRWPSALETSGPWLRAMAQGRPTIVTDLLHQIHVPVIDPRTWTSTPAGIPPVAVAVDILDEDHSLALAMRRLATDADLRTALGAAARTYWTNEHTVARMLEGYLAALARAVSEPLPSVTLPDGLRTDTSGDYVRSLTTGFDGVTCELF
jgi:hypothetical protein